MVVKAGIGLLGLGAISIGGVAFAKPEWLGINKEIPWDSLGKDHDYENKSKTGQDYDSKFGSKHKYYLVGVVGTKSEANTENTNKAIWEELFKKWKSDSASPESKAALGKGFKGNIEGEVNPGTGGNEKYLNTVCQEAYKADTNSITATGSDDNYKESSVWKYCSPLGEKPKTIAEVDTENQQYRDQVSGSDPIGKNDTDRKKLVSTTGNNLFWTIRDKEFKNEDGHDKIETGDTEDAFFKKEGTTTIRDLCEKAYKSKENSAGGTATEPKKEKVMQYCTLDKSSQ